VGHKLPVTETYVDADGSRVTHASRAGFESLMSRVIDGFGKVSGFGEDSEVMTWVEDFVEAYDLGFYTQALQCLKMSLRKIPALEPRVFYYVRVCERVLAVSLTPPELDYERGLEKYRDAPKWKRALMKSPEVLVRCKWCGHYTTYIHPYVPTFGFAIEANGCRNCGRMYPMPSWIWDSPDGRIYSYYRMSFSDEAFYEEFEQDYDPTPRCQRRG